VIFADRLTVRARGPSFADLAKVERRMKSVSQVVGQNAGARRSAEAANFLFEDRFPIIKQASARQAACVELVATLAYALDYGLLFRVHL